MNILGLNYYHPDSSAVLLKNGEIIAAAEEERFVRIKHYSGFPQQSINFCLKKGGIYMSDLHFVVLNFDSNSNLKEKILYSIKNIYKSATLKKLYNLKNKFKNKDHLKKYLYENNFKGKIVHIDHHLSHFASSLYLSNYKNCIGLTIDGFGDFCSMQSFIFRNNEIKLIKKVSFPHSLGIFYQATTQYLGFKNYGDEYKLMGLASYGKPSLVNEFDEIVQYSKKNLFKLNLEYFTHHVDKKFKYFFNDGRPIFNDLYSNKYIQKFGKPRKKDEPITDHHKNIACSMQNHFENIVLKILNSLYEEYKVENLCLAGGCAFNSKLNGLIKNKTNFKNIFIQPNAGDAGGALGACLVTNNKISNQKQNLNNIVYLGPDYSNNYIEDLLKDRNDLANFKIKKISDNEIYKLTAKKISNDLIIGWFKGRMEWGPRALGNRSILANPTNKNIKNILNLKIKLREKFRPFAPSIMFEEKEKYFKMDYHSPFMLNVVEAKEIAKQKIPAAVHVDNTCRVQTVKEEENFHFYNLIKNFNELTGVPVLINTSFNENEPIVQNPEEALNCFLRTNMDFLVLENWTISR